MQAAYSSAFEHLHTFREESSFRTWITRIVVNHCLMAIRHPWRQRRVDNYPGPAGDLLHNFASPAKTPEMWAWNQQVAGALESAFRRLARRLRAAYGLYALSEMSVSEVAASLGLTVASAKSRIFRARKAMRNSLHQVRRSAPLDADSVLPGFTGTSGCTDVIQ